MDDRLVHTVEPGPTELAVENERLQRALRARLEEEQALRRIIVPSLTGTQLLRAIRQDF